MCCVRNKRGRTWDWDSIPACPSPILAEKISGLHVTKFSLYFLKLTVLFDGPFYAHQDLILADLVLHNGKPNSRVVEARGSGGVQVHQGYHGLHTTLSKTHKTSVLLLFSLLIWETFAYPRIQFSLFSLANAFFLPRNLLYWVIAGAKSCACATWCLYVSNTQKQSS